MERLKSAESYSHAVGGFARGLKLADVPAGGDRQSQAGVVSIRLASRWRPRPWILARWFPTWRPRNLAAPGDSAMIGSANRVAAANAVIANGTLAHGLDYDDTLEEAIVHTGACAWMTALAVGEEVGASGAAFLKQPSSAPKCLCKVGLVAPGKFHARGFHPTAICSTFGAAAVAGKLYGLSADQWVDAFGLCGSQSSGIIEYLADGTWTKRMHPGWSAHGGIIACLLAQEGFRGPAKVFRRHPWFFQRPSAARTTTVSKSF